MKRNTKGYKKRSYFSINYGSKQWNSTRNGTNGGGDFITPLAGAGPYPTR